MVAAGQPAAPITVLPWPPEQPQQQRMVLGFLNAKQTPDAAPAMGDDMQ